MEKTSIFAGGGEMGALMRAHDWSTSPIGCPDTWPHALRSAVSLMLPNKQIMFVAWGPELTFLYNDAYRPVFGKKHPWALGRPFREIWSEVWDDVAPLVDTALGGEATWSEDLHLVLERNGYPEDCWFTFSYSPARDESGKIAGLFCAAAETTEKVLTDQRLIADRDRQRRQFQQAPGFVCILDGPDHVYEFANQAYERMVGRGGLVGKTVREAMPDIAGQGFYELLDTVYATGQRFVASHVPVTLVPAPGGVAREHYLDFVYEPVLDEVGRVTGIFTQGHDVTEAHLARVALALNERRQAFRIGLDDALRDIADPREVMATAAELLGKQLAAGRCGFAEIDDATEYVTVLRDWTDGTLSSAVGQFRMDDFGRPFIDGLRAGRAIRLEDPLADPKTAGDDVAAAYAALDFRGCLAVPILKEGRWVAAIFVHQAQPRIWTDEDEALVLEVAERTWATVGRARAETALRDLNADLEGQVEARLDELRGVEAHLRQAQKMEAVGQLTGGIAHDFNNMLTGVIGGLDIVRRRLRDGRHDDVDRFIDVAYQSAERASALTKRLLAFSRRQSLEPKILDVNALAAGLYDMLQWTLGESTPLTLALQPDIWPIEADAGQLENSLLNLAIDARDAMPDGGTLTVETINVTVDAAVPDLLPGDYVRISVSDEGIGMSQAVMDRAFDPFFTTKAIGQGTGLGLSMIYGFVKQSHGHVAIDSAPGQGTRIRLWLPRAVGDVAFDELRVAAVASRPRAGTTVMIVEDEPSVRMLIGEVLTELGYEFVEAADGDEALPILRSDQRIDLLVSDVGLPGMNGRQLAEMARAIRPGLRVLFVTAYAEGAVVRGGFLDDGMDMVAKPFSVDVLAEKILSMVLDA